MIVDLSCSEQSPAGRFLSRLYYETDLMDVFTRDERAGFPHDGGVHSLQLRLPLHDIQAFIELVQETYDTKKGCQEFLDHCRSVVPSLQ